MLKSILTLTALGVVAFAAHDALANDADKDHVKSGEVLNSTPGDVKTSNDDSGMNNDAAKNDKVGTIPGESTPGDVKTSNDDSGMNHDDAAHDKSAKDKVEDAKH